MIATVFFNFAFYLRKGTNQLGVFDKIFAGDNAGKLRKIDKLADAVMALEGGFETLSDRELVAMTADF